MSTEKPEQEILEGKLDRALAEARTRTAKAIDSIMTASSGYEKDVWAAAEASEYASLIYALTYDLEDVTVPIRRKEDREVLALAKEAAQTLEKVQGLRGTGTKESIIEGYSLWREATDALRNAYLALTRPKQGDRPEPSSESGRTNGNSQQ